MPCPCPCGCPKPVKPGNTYASPGCGGRRFLRAMPAAWHADAVLARMAQMTPEAVQASVRKANSARRRENYERLMARWLEIAVEQGDPRRAIAEAQERGYNAGYIAGRRWEAKPWHT